jgi:hypothetical protein
MFDKVINDKEVSVKVTFTLFGNHCCHPRFSKEMQQWQIQLNSSPTLYI